MRRIAILYSQLFLSLAALSSEVLQFQDIVVTETRDELELKLAPSQITIMGREDLETRSRESLKDILLFDSSIFTLRSRGSDFLSIRGFTQGRILILIDGRRLSGEVDRTFEMDRITLDRVERVEVVKGPVSVLYGTDALGGVVNIITREPEEREMSFSVRYGEPPAESQISFSAYTGRVGSFNLGVFGRLKRGSAYRLPNGTTPIFEIDVKSAGLSLFHYMDRAGKRKIRLDYDYLKHDEEGTLSFGYRNMKVIHNNLRQNFSLSVSFRERSWNLFARGYASTYEKDYERRRADTGQLSDFDVADRDTYVLESWVGARVLPTHRLTVGGEFRRELFDATRIRSGEFRGSVQREGVSKNRYRVTIDHYALYVQDEWSVTDSLFLISGVRYDDSDTFGSDLSPKVGITFLPTESLRLKASYAQGFKTPTPRELFIFFPGFGYWIVGNPDLGSERTENVDVSLELDLPRKTTVRLGTFYTSAKDLIETDFVCVGGMPGCTVNGTPVPPGTALITFRNVGSATIKGGELSVRSNPSGALLLSASYTYLDARDDSEDERLLQRPRHRAVARKTADIDRFGLRASLFVEYTADMLYTSVESKSFLLAHVSFSKSIYGGFHLVGGVDNLGDKRDFDLGLVGRFYWLGVRGQL